MRAKSWSQVTDQNESGTAKNAWLWDSLSTLDDIIIAAGNPFGRRRKDQLQHGIVNVVVVLHERTAICSAPCQPIALFKE